MVHADRVNLCLYFIFLAYIIANIRDLKQPELPLNPEKKHCEEGFKPNIHVEPIELDITVKTVLDY